MTEAQPGVAAPVDRLVTQVLAPNASPYTHTGTQTFLVGEQDLAVIDPGPDDAGHITALLAAIGGRPVTAILVTHTHRDHSPASRALKAATGAPIVGCAPITVDDGSPPGESPFDRDYAPDRVLREGDAVAGAGWTLKAVETPGHTSNHLAFALPETRALFPGDHVMGWSTTVVIPPDGDMGSYIASLEKLLDRDDRIYFPTHGPPIENPQRLVRHMIGHRRQREKQILRLLGEGAASVPALVARMYVGIDAKLVGAAERSVLAHLLDLRGRSLVREEDGNWRLAG